MAASNRHRKLIPDSTNGPAVVVQFCIIQCDPQENPAGLCIPTCSVICPSFCRIIDSSPPPSSSSATPVGLPYPPSTPPKHHQPPLPLPFKISLIVIAATFSLFLLYSLYKFYTVWHRFRRHHAAPPPPPSPQNHGIHDDFLDHDVLDHPIWYIRTVGLQPSVINAITVVKFSKDNGVVEGTDCSVCLSEFQADETLRLLPNCNHAFHISCIDTWLTYHTNCPLCRAGIVNSTVESTSPEQNTDDLGTTEEAHLGISILGDDNPEEDSESSELRIGGTDGQDQNNTAKAEVVGGCGGNDFLTIRRSVSLDDLAASDHHAIQFQSVRGDLGAESPKREGYSNPNQSSLTLIGGSSSPSSMRRSISCSGKAVHSKQQHQKRQP